PQGQLSARPVCAWLHRPGEAGTQIVMLSLESVTPPPLLSCVEEGFGLFCQSEVIRSMGLSDGLSLPTSSECLQPILTNRLVHQQAGLVRVLFGSGEQVFVQEGTHPIEHLDVVTIHRTSHILPSFQGPAPPEPGRP